MKRGICYGLVALGVLGVGGPRAWANPIQGFIVNTPDCDFVQDQLVEELGLPIALGGPFPTNEGIDWVSQPTQQVICVPDDGVPNDWVVSMVNLTPNSYGRPVGAPVYFVANVDVFVGNRDGVADFTPFPGLADAFEIDSLGLNANLIAESGVFDNIWRPGEIWVFLVTNFVTPGAILPPAFLSLGHSVGISSGGGTASIVIGVPEPGSVALLGIGAVGLLAASRLRRRGSARVV